MKEADLSREIQIEASNKYGARIFRNNVGLFNTLDGRKIRTGLCEGSSDLIGWTKDGRFLAIEVKKPKGFRRLSQKNFIEQVNKSGGIGFFAYSAEDLKEHLS